MSNVSLWMRAREYLRYQVSAYPARSRRYWLARGVLNQWRLDAWVRLARRIPAFRDIFFSPAAPPPRPVTVADMSVAGDGAAAGLEAAVVENLRMHGICFITNALPEQEWAAFRRLAATDPGQLAAGEIRVRDIGLSSSVRVDLRMAKLRDLPHLARYAQLCSRLVYGKALLPEYVEINNARCHALPDVDVPYNNTWHTDRFLPTLKLLYAPFEVTAEQGPFTFYRGSHRIDPRFEAKMLRRLLKDGYEGFEQTLQELPFDQQRVVECRAAPNTLIAVLTNGFHTRGRFATLCTRTIGFIDYYNSFGKFQLLKAAWRA